MLVSLAICAGFAALAGAIVAASVRTLLSREGIASIETQVANGTRAALALTVSAWAACMLLWCGASLWLTQDARALGGPVAGGLALGACAVSALSRGMVQPPRIALYRQSGMALAGAVAWGWVLGMGPLATHTVWELGLVLPTYVVGCIGVWFLTLTADGQASARGTHMAETLSVATPIILLGVVLRPLSMYAGPDAVFRLAGAAMSGILGVSVLHLWPAARRRVADRPRTLFRSTVPLLILGIGLVAVLLALIGAAGVTYIPAIPALLCLVVGGAYVPYALLCASDAKAKASDSKQ